MKLTKKQLTEMIREAVHDALDEQRVQPAQLAPDIIEILNILKMAEEKADQLLASQVKGYESPEAKRVHAELSKQVKSIEFWLDQLRRKRSRSN